MTTIRVGLVGDFSPAVAAHVAITQALAVAASDLGVEVAAAWLPTEGIAPDPGQLARFDALWCVPASPYASMDGALTAIRFAREQGRPFLGTCGGFQHAVIEYARKVLGRAEADHAESNPAAGVPLVAPLACSLIGATGTVRLRAGSRVRDIYGADEVVEAYHCNYGINARYQSWLEAGKLRVTGTDSSGDARAVELDGHPFFIATLYQPERSALSGGRHPLIRAYVRAAAEGVAG